MPRSRNSGSTWLAVNGASGGNAEDRVASLKQALTGAGRAPARMIDVREEGCPTRAELDAADVSLLTVFTGDGSANAIITGLESWHGDVLLLPGGTANLLARDLHGEAEAEAIVAALAAERLAALPRHAIHCSAGVGLIEVLAGPGATWSDVREGLREGDIGTVAGTTIEAAKQSAAGPMVRVADPSLGRDEGYSGVRLSPVGAEMTVDGYGARNVADTIKQGIALLRRDFREGPHDELGRHGQVACRSIDGSPIELMIDGERLTGRAEEIFSLAPLRVNLLASRHG
jgi:hypothetical protein